MMGKRLFDFILAFFGLLFLAPIMVGVAVWIKIESPGAVFFRQKRIGRGGEPFHILKFRTMVSGAELRGGKITIKNDPRITRSGFYLRKYKFDELPQLINVLKGEMSLVGPRPEVPEYVAYYPEKAKEVILSVLPGITDFASIKFKDESELMDDKENYLDLYISDILPEKIALCTSYVQERSFLMDLQIIIKTIKKILIPGCP